MSVQQISNNAQLDGMVWYTRV